MERFYIGTYTEPIRFGTGEILQGKGEGIYTAEFDEKTKKLNVIGLIRGVKNPSYVAVSPDKTMVYAVNELKEYKGEKAGSVSSFRIIKEKGDLSFVSQASTHGQDPCHVAVCGEGRWIVATNFMTGSVCSYGVEPDGTLMETGFVQHEGSSIHPVRQKGPHAHSCIPVPGTKRVIIPDLGLDRLMVYEIDADGRLEFCEKEVYDCLPGSGPRFGEFCEEKDLLYVINELGSAISVLHYDRDEKRFEHIQQISTLPEECENICADLHMTPDRTFLYASNRGHDSITCFRVLDDGRLKWESNVSCGGKTPRNFAVARSGGYLLVGNQDTDEVVIFQIDRQTGRLTEVSRCQVPTPVCLCQV